MTYLREICQRKVTGMAGYEGMAGSTDQGIFTSLLISTYQGSSSRTTVYSHGKCKMGFTTLRTCHVGNLLGW